MIKDVKVGDKVTVLTDGQYHGKEGTVVSITEKKGYRDVYSYEIIEVNISGQSVSFKDWQITR